MTVSSTRFTFNQPNLLQIEIFFYFSVNCGRKQQEKDEIEQVTLRIKSGHRRQSSVGISWNKFEEQQRRRSSYASWVRDDDDDDEEMSRSTRTRSRPCSWGPVGEFYFRESMCLSETDRSMLSHQACKGFLVTILQCTQIVVVRKTKCTPLSDVHT